ncbi:MAG TPA: TraB/GumN family protein [Crocinitomicaceae bacterium]|nr:TraB/GumN family protein [Crocinitomicaceae bacterium]
MKQYFLVISLLTYGLGVCQPNLDKPNQLLWEITKKGIKQPSYILGTIHLNDAKLFQFNDSIYYAFYNTSVFSTEVDVRELYGVFDTPFNKNLLIDASGRIYSAVKTTYKSDYGSVMGYPQFLDAYFYQIAVNSNKKIVPLETINDQVLATQSISYSLFPRVNKSISQDEMLQLYLSGNPSKLQQLVYEGYKGTTGYSELIVKRNEKMVAKIDSLITKTPAFIAVGAGHLAGKHGILTALHERGYVVRAVGATQTTHFQKEKNFFKENRTYLYDNNELCFKAVFGIRPTETFDADGYIRLEARDLGQGNLYLIEGIQLHDDNSGLKQFINESFNSPVNAKILRDTLANQTEYYEGIVNIDEYGLCWRRMLIHKGWLYKLTCSGSLPFLSSNRPKSFFNQVEFY